MAPSFRDEPLGPTRFPIGSAAVILAGAIDPSIEWNQPSSDG